MSNTPLEAVCSETDDTYLAEWTRVVGTTRKPTILGALNAFIGASKFNPNIIILFLSGALAVVGLVANVLWTPQNWNSVQPSQATAVQELAPSATNPDLHERIRFFRDTAVMLDPITDKVNKHRYQNMYGTFLLPYAVSKPEMKLLEIGLGCTMKYGPGASFALWKYLFPNAKLWVADHDAECVAEAFRQNQLQGVNTLVGDQADPKVLDGWIEKSRGKFDIIIDDGGHSNCQINNSFEKLWPQLLPGGMYFIEDMSMGRSEKRNEDSGECGDVIMSERIQEWMDRLLYSNASLRYRQTYKYTMPKGVMFVHCQAEACVIGKRKGEFNDPFPKKGESKV